MVNCRLCSNHAEFYFHDEQPGRPARDYFHCSICDLRFLHPSCHLNASEERARYELHDNNIDDVRYQDYMRPIAEWVERHQPSGLGLDFGCGKGPVLAQLLQQKGFEIHLFDPYFFPDTGYSRLRYDFCTAIETIEHFYSPQKDLIHLKSLLKPEGGLGLVTLLYREGLDFESWHYRLDPTHVCFYSEKTFLWIQNHLGFKSYETDGIKLNWLRT